MSQTDSTPVQEEYTGLPEFKEAYVSVRKAIRSKSPYDIDKTIKVMNTLELTQQSKGDLDGFLEEFARMNLKNVAPDVLTNKLAILDVLQDMRKIELEDADFKCTLAFASGLNFTRRTAENVIDGNSIGIKETVALISKETLTNGFDEIERAMAVNQEYKKKYQARINELRSRYLQCISSYMPIYEKHCREWDALCLQRDRAYIDIYHEQFETACKTTSKILEQYPENRETMLLNALSLVMLGMNSMNGAAQGKTSFACLDISHEAAQGANSEDCFSNAQKVIDKYIDLYPGYSAPALVLRGIIEICRGQDSEGIASLDHASMEYPRQSSSLMEMFDLYKSRAYLNKSIEGKYLLRLYRSTMEGFGIFSPNLIKAGYYARHNDNASSKREIFNHFFRRGNQDGYDCLLSDMQFCEKYLDSSLIRMLPEHSFMDIAISGSLFNKNKICVSINNRSNVILQNVRVFLCIHLTDMYTDEYEIVKFPTQNQIPSMQKTEIIATMPPILNDKSYNDITRVRAIVMTDDAICWMDNVQTKFQNALDTCKKLVEAKQSLNQIDQRLVFSGLDTAKLEKDLLNKTTSLLYLKERAIGFKKEMINKLSSAIAISPERKWLKSEGKLKLILPRSIVILDPVFSLKQTDGQLIQPSVSIINDCEIRLLFDVEPAENEQFDLYIYNKYTAIKLLLTRTGDEMAIQKLVFL